MIDRIARWLFSLLHPIMIADGKVWHRMGAFSDEDEADNWAHELWKAYQIVKAISETETRHTVWVAIGEAPEQSATNDIGTTLFRSRVDMAYSNPDLAHAMAKILDLPDRTPPEQKEKCRRSEKWN